MANPLFGSTATHAAALFAALGAEFAKGIFEGLKWNDVQVFEGNSIVCEQVAQGRCLLGITDTDDFWERKARGMPIEIVYPDQSPAGIEILDSGERELPPFGCFVFPNTVARVTNCPHARQSEKLIDYLYSREVEQKLAFGPSRQIPMLGNDIPVPAGVRKLSELKVMQVDYDKVAEALPVATAFLEELFAR